MKKILYLVFLFPISITVFTQDVMITNNEIKGSEDFNKFRTAVNGGYSYMTAKISKNTPSSLKNYAKELKSGYHFSIDASYYLKETFGFGIKFSMFGSQNELDNIILEDTVGNIQSGKLSDKITIIYIGPTYVTRLITSDKNNAFIFGISIGYIGYTNNYVVINDYKMTGNDVGFDADIAYDRKITDKISLGIQISYISSNLIEYKINDGTSTQIVKLSDGDEKISLNHLDFSLGIRINL